VRNKRVSQDPRIRPLFKLASGGSDVLCAHRERAHDGAAVELQNVHRVIVRIIPHCASQKASAHVVQGTQLERTRDSVEGRDAYQETEHRLCG
jgi:hypothetical protein